jgi:type IV secretion system protein VirB9
MAVNWKRGNGMAGRGAKTAMMTAALAALFCFPSASRAATPEPAPRPAMEKANAEASKQQRQKKAEEERAKALERLRQQYPDLQIPDSAEIVWAEPGDTPPPLEETANAEATDLFAEFSSPKRSGLGGKEYTSELPTDDDLYEPTPQELQDAQLAQLWMDVQEDLDLREIDRKALSLVREFAGAKNAVPPTPGQNGAVTYNFGDHIPKIVCRMNRVTDISLEAGERVTGVHMGDTVRWQISPAKSGAGETETTHVIVKPLVPDISTNLVVMTDRRTYNLDLVASAAEFIPSVRFAYPDDVMSAWSAFVKNSEEKKKGDGLVLAESHRTSPEDLYFGYKIEKGSSYEWAPVRIFDDGVKTYIEMQAKYKSMEAPVVLFFEGRQKKIVNYRVKDRFYVIDRIMSGKAALILGQKQIVIQRVNPKRGG